MGGKSKVPKVSVVRKRIALHERGGPAKESLHNQATIGEFDRERMGIAAKE